LNLKELEESKTEGTQNEAASPSADEKLKQQYDYLRDPQMTLRVTKNAANSPLSRTTTPISGDGDANGRSSPRWQNTSSKNDKI